MKRKPLDGVFCLGHLTYTKIRQNRFKTAEKAAENYHATLTVFIEKNPKNAQKVMNDYKTFAQTPFTTQAVRTTYCEITHIRDLLQANPSTKVGITSSIWHMPRVMCLVLMHIPKEDRHRISFLPSWACITFLPEYIPKEFKSWKKLIRCFKQHYIKEELQESWLLYIGRTLIHKKKPS